MRQNTLPRRRTSCGKFLAELRATVPTKVPLELADKHLRAARVRGKSVAVTGRHRDGLVRTRTGGEACESFEANDLLVRQ